MTRRRTYLFAACLVALLAGFGLARALIAPGGQGGSRAATASTAPSVRTIAQRSRTASTARAVGRSGPGPWRRVEGIPSGFADTERGAVAAAGSYLTVLARAISPTAGWSWTQAIRTLTVEPLTARALAAAKTNQATRQRLALAGRSFVGSWLLGYRVSSYARARARVAVWNMGLLASPADVVAPYYSTATCTLQWIDGDWKIASVETSAGPTPPSTPGPGQTAAFINSAGRFIPYRDAP